MASSSAAGPSPVGDLLGDTLFGSPGAGARDIETLRQHMIVHLLLKVCSIMDHTPGTFLEQYAQLVKMGLLSHDTLFCAMQTCRPALFPAPSSGSICRGASSDQQIVPVRDANDDLARPLGVDARSMLPLLQGVSRFEKDFVRIELLGKGSFGEVWRCRHRIDGGEYAVKIVRFRCRGLGRSDGMLERRILREVQTWARLSHTNITGYNHAWIEADWSRSEWICNPARGDPAPDAHCAADSHVVHAASGSLAAESSQNAHHLSTIASATGSATSASSSASVVFERQPVPQALTPPQGALRKSPKSCTNSSTPLLPGELALINQHLSYNVTLYIQSELCRKETLLDWLNQRNARVQGATSDKQSIREALDIFLQSLMALAHMHSKACVHRDVKPSNVFFAQDGTLRLGDFGLAKEVLQQPVTDERVIELHMNSCHSGQVGTPSYASPEQREGLHYGVSTDIFSMGLLLIELFCPMRTQMERSSIFEEVRSHGAVPESLTEAFPALATLARRMTMREPLERPSAQDVLTHSSELLLEIQSLYGDEALPEAYLASVIVPSAARAASPFVSSGLRLAPGSPPLIARSPSPTRVDFMTTSVPELQLPETRCDAETGRLRRRLPEAFRCPGRFGVRKSRKWCTRDHLYRRRARDASQLQSRLPEAKVCSTAAQTELVFPESADLSRERAEAQQFLDTATAPELRKHLSGFVCHCETIRSGRALYGVDFHYGGISMQPPSIACH